MARFLQEGHIDVGGPSDLDEVGPGGDALVHVPRQQPGYAGRGLSIKARWKLNQRPGLLKHERLLDAGDGRLGQRVEQNLRGSSLRLGERYGPQDEAQGVHAGDGDDDPADDVDRVSQAADCRVETVKASDDLALAVAQLCEALHA